MNGMTHSHAQYILKSETDLDRIRTKFLQMCARAENMVGQAIRSLLDRDARLARSVVSSDPALDNLELEIDGLCIRYLATAKPEGFELRFTTTIMKMVTDLERIGDLAVNIAERGLDIGPRPGLGPGDEIEKMGEAVVEMLRDATDAFVSLDSSVEARLRRKDKSVDTYNRQAFKTWIQVMSTQPDDVPRALAYTSVSRYLERIADHAVNLGQMILLLVEGLDVRHTR